MKIWKMVGIKKGMITMDNKEVDYRIVDIYGDKMLKISFGLNFDRRYEIWEGRALRAHYSDKMIAFSDWNRIKETEPPIKQQEKMDYIEM